MEKNLNMLGHISVSERRSIDKAERTTLAALEITQGEARRAAANTSRLREARLARDAAMPAPEKPKRAPRRKAS